jgi:hypothetical protein
VPNGTARVSAQPLFFSVISEAALRVWRQAPDLIEGHRDEVCASTQEQDLPVLWSPINRNESRQDRRMRRRAPTRGDSAQRRPASKQAERSGRFPTCGGSRECRGDVASAHVGRVIPGSRAPGHEHSRCRGAPGHQGSTRRKHVGGCGTQRVDRGALATIQRRRSRLASRRSFSYSRCASRTSFQYSRSASRRSFSYSRRASRMSL